MFLKLIETNSKTHYINTALIAVVAIGPSGDKKQTVAEIKFSGGAEVELLLDNAQWAKFQAVLEPKYQPKRAGAV